MIIEGLILKFIFGKFAAGAVIKTGAAVATKAWVAHDAIQAVSALSDAASVADAATTVTDVTNAATSVSDINDGATILAGGTASALPGSAWSGGILSPDDLVVSSDVTPAPDFQTAAVGGTGLQEHASTIHGGPENTNGHGNPPTDIHGNPEGRNGHGHLPGNIHGTPYTSRIDT